MLSLCCVVVRRSLIAFGGIAAFGTAGCGAEEPDPPAPRPRLAGALEAAVRGSEFTPDSAALVVGSAGNATLLFDDDVSVQVLDVDARGFLDGPASLADGGVEQVALLAHDGELLTAGWLSDGAWSLRRRAPGGRFSTLPAPPGEAGSIAAGFSGELAQVSIACDELKRLAVSRFDGDAWNEAEILAEGGACDDPLGPVDAAATFTSEGGLLIVWGAVSFDGAGRPFCCTAHDDRFDPGSGFRGPETFGAYNELSALSLKSDRSGSAWLVAGELATTAQGPVPAWSARRHDGSAWGALRLFDRTGDAIGFDVGAGGSALFAWLDSTLKTSYAPPGGSWEAVSPPARDERPSELRVALDGEGRAVLVFARPSVDPARGAELFYSRYAPDSGWTRPGSVSGERPLGGSRRIVSLAMNDAGEAAVLWSEATETAAELWFARVP